MNPRLQGTNTTTTGSDNPAAERIRENQRRSRARRKEHIENMQRRLDEYEKQGVDATLQMQQAARTVAIENSRLRILLAQRGVYDGEVDKFLAAFEQQHAGAGESESPLTGYPPPHSHMSYTPSSSASQGGALDRLAVLADASVGERCCGGKTNCSSPYEETLAAVPSPPSAGPSTMPGTPTSSGHQQHHHSQQHTTPMNQTGGAAGGSPLVMSCNTAAQIIAEMQGHGAGMNKHNVRASLGCEDDECECFVKNTLLFQLMERNAA